MLKYPSLFKLLMALMLAAFGTGVVAAQGEATVSVQEDHNSIISEQIAEAAQDAVQVAEKADPADVETTAGGAESSDTTDETDASHDEQLPEGGAAATNDDGHGHGHGH